MAIKKISDFEKALKKDMEALFGNCAEFKGVFRAMGENFGVSKTGVIIEAAFEAGLDPEVPYPILHFHVTLAHEISDDEIPGILAGLNDLNTVISAGAFPSFGCFGFYPPLRQIYLSYRMPVNKDALDKELENARFYLKSLYEQLDLFADYILFLCNDPSNVTIDAYMDYLDSVAELNDLEERYEAAKEYFDKK